MEAHINKLNRLIEDYFDLIEHMRLQQLENDDLEAQFSQYVGALTYCGDSLEVELSFDQIGSFMTLSEDFRLAKSDLKTEEKENIKYLESAIIDILSKTASKKIRLQTNHGHVSLYVNAKNKLYIRKEENV
ncbi:hypothetical protein H8S90_10395 [Olivibacter sp. SDN3]|uniref:hypothetical protein n=1 Tax=Olivibacter sp. SDN3 TaxID=2764720 RepID=UPI0016511F10|nr:hypothetical protein [Olivibacter sp. SDN3]QNL51943.1 hypothetical protein H8S90_10395 [Olivibacter sp. SDN3]